MQTAIEHLPASEDLDVLQEHKRIAEKYKEIIQSKIPPNYLIEGVTIDFALPSEGQIRIHGHRENGEIKENVFIFAAPSNYSNLFKNLRRKFYTALKKFAFILGKGEGGRNLYLIPFENIPAFLETIDELKEQFKELENEINAYLSSSTTEAEREYLENVRKYLQDQTNVYSDSALNFRVELNFSYYLTPLRMDSKTLLGFADDHIRKALENSMERCEEEFQKTRERLIHQMVATLNEKFSVILKRLATACLEEKHVKYPSICRAVDETMALAMSVNLGPIHKGIEDLADAIKATAEVLSEKKLEKESLEIATAKIAKALEIEATDPSEILEKATYDLNAMSARAAEVIRRM